MDWPTQRCDSGAQNFDLERHLPRLSRRSTPGSPTGEIACSSRLGCQGSLSENRTGSPSGLWISTRGAVRSVPPILVYSNRAVISRPCSAVAGMTTLASSWPGVPAMTLNAPVRVCFVDPWEACKPYDPAARPCRLKLAKSVLLSLKLVFSAARALPPGPIKLTVVPGVNWSPLTVRVTGPAFRLGPG